MYERQQNVLFIGGRMRTCIKGKFPFDLGAIAQTRTRPSPGHGHRGKVERGCLAPQRFFQFRSSPRIKIKNIHALIGSP